MSRFSDEYAPEPDYDRPSSNREAMADEAGMPERDEEFIRQTYKTTNPPAPEKEQTVSTYDVAHGNDPTEATRREMIATGQPAADLAATEAAEAPTWTTDELSRDFEVLGFMAPFVVVRRRSDGQKGTLEFQHQPRVYFGWSAS